MHGVRMATADAYSYVTVVCDSYLNTDGYVFILKYVEARPTGRLTIAWAVYYSNSLS